VWKVVDGALKPEVAGGWLATKEDFTNFQLHVEFRTSAPNINSGVFLRRGRQDGDSHQIGYELQIRNLAPGDKPYDGKSDNHNAYYTGSFSGHLKSKNEPTVIMGQWHAFDVTAQGDHFVVLFDGKKVLDDRHLVIPDLSGNNLLDSLGNIAALYLIDSAEQGRSKWRIDALRLNFNAHILPFFKAETPIASIKKSRIEDFIKHHKRRNVKNSTIWHYIKDLRALFYWAMAHPDEDRPFLRANPVSGANLDPIQNRKVVKPPLKIKDFERAFAVLDQYERAWWRTHDSLGLRMDEGNRLQKTDVDFDSGLIRIPGTKTAESD
jgi:hypothetical protein